MRRWLLVLACWVPAWLGAQTLPLKQLASVVGVRGNQLLGYGLVVGLSGSGDTGKSFAAVDSVLRLLEHLGTALSRSDLSVANCAAVLVTAKLPPSIGPGETIDVTVSSLGNARSLAGGTLILTPLKGLDEKVYAVAQGPVSVGGYALAPGANDSLQKNLPTVGRVPSGAIMERSVTAQFISGTALSMALGRTDFLASSRAVAALNAKFGEGTAKSPDGARLDLTLPDAFAKDAVGFLAVAGELPIEVPDPVKVVVNERTGAVIVGGTVPLAPLSVTHGSLHLAVTARNSVSQPNSLATGSTQVVTQLDLKAQEDGGQSYTLRGPNATVEDLVTGLSKLGVSPRDIIALLQDVRSMGAMQAELEIR